MEFRFRFPAFLPSSSQSQLVNGTSLPPCPSGIVGFSKKRVQARSTLIAFSRMASSSISFMSGHVAYVLEEAFPSRLELCYRSGLEEVLLTSTCQLADTILC